MINERKIMFSDYAVNLARAHSTNIIEKLKNVSLFLETDLPISRKGLKEYETTNRNIILSGTYPNAVHNSIVDFLQFMGMGGSKRRKIKKEKEVKALEVLSEMSKKNVESLSNFMLYLENEKDYSKNTLAIYMHSLKDFFRYATDFNQDNARRYIQTLTEKGYKPQTLRLRITSLERYGVFVHKTIAVKRPKCQKSLSTENVPTEKEYHKLLDYLREKGDIKHSLWIRLLATTGARISEFLQLTYEDIAKGETTLQGKGNKYRRIFFQKTLATEILQYAKENNLSGVIATGRLGTPISSRGLSSQLKVWGEKAGLDKSKMHPHAFRHLFAKMYLKKNKDINELAGLLGHSNIATTMLYLQKNSDEQRKDFNKNVTW